MEHPDAMEQTKDALTGKTALVTGAGRGIGRATAVALARAGVSTIVLIARTAEQLETAAADVREAGARPYTAAADLAELTELPALAATLSERVGHIDILINNAGVVAPLGPTLGLPLAEVHHAFALNTVAPIRLAAHLLPGMLARGWGRVVNVSSGVVAHPAGMVGGSTYAATKAALEAQTVSFAAEHAGTGVTINVYRPGGVDTAMQEWIRDQDPDRIGRTLHDRFVAGHASGTLLTPAQSAAALVAHLHREETGQIWDVTGTR